MFKVISKNLTEFFGLTSASLTQMVKSSGMVFFLFGTNIAWNLFGFTILWFVLSQFTVVWGSSMSISINKLRSDHGDTSEYDEKVISSA